MSACPSGITRRVGGRLIKQLSHPRFQAAAAKGQPPAPEACATTPAAPPVVAPPMVPPAAPTVGGMATVKGGDLPPKTDTQDLCGRIREMFQEADEEYPMEIGSGSAGRPAEPPDPEAVAHTVWFKENRHRLPKESFQLSAGKYITNTEQFYRALDDEMAAYPNAIRAHVIGQDLLQLRRHAEERPLP